MFEIHCDGWDDADAADRSSGGTSISKKEEPPVHHNDSTIYNAQLQDEAKESRWLRRRWYRCTHNHVSVHWPRLWAFLFGVVLPILALVLLASLCGYPLALLESPSELSQNDFILEQQMRLLLQKSLYANLTQKLPRVCLHLYFSNSSIDDLLQNLTAILEGPPTNEDVKEFVLDNWGPNETQPEWDNATEWMINGSLASTSILMNMTTANISLSSLNNTYSNLPTPTTTRTSAIPDTASTEDILAELEERFRLYYDYFTYDLETLLPKHTNNQTATEQSVVNLTDLSTFVEDCGNGLGPTIDKMFLTLAKTANQALMEPLSFAWNRCGNTRHMSLEHTTTSPNTTREDDLDMTRGFYRSLLDNNLPVNWTFLLQDLVSHNSASRSIQAAYYRVQWENDRRRLYVQYLLEEETRFGALQGRRYNNQTHNDTDIDPAIWRRMSAFEKSLQDATGGENCFPNIPASCWFWFTGKYTIGPCSFFYSRGIVRTSWILTSLLLPS